MSDRYYDMVKIEELQERRMRAREANAAAKPLAEATAEQWGVGDKTDARPFSTGRLSDGTEYELIFGEHPHSRQDNNIYARFENGEIHGFNGHRGLVKIEVEMSNYLKDSDLSGSEVRKGGVARLFVDGDLIYEFFSRDPEHAMRRMMNLIPELQEHSSEVWSKEGRERLVGRKIYYQNVPATITMWIPDQAAVVIDADEGHRFPKPVWWGDDDGSGDDDWEWSDHTKVDLLSKDIWWHRREKDEQKDAPSGERLL